MFTELGFLLLRAPNRGTIFSIVNIFVSRCHFYFGLVSG